MARPPLLMFQPVGKRMPERHVEAVFGGHHLLILPKACLVQVASTTDVLSMGGQLSSDLV